ncbi:MULTISPECIES: MFS transporter [Streptosporangium]|uniref:MFS family permease n=1 Tax=Streptosporangium brasiliense TaxID=47480 RepID=A0ABT9QWR5_9ACTN|nr:MFS transporter [Streptosporangium brasiliense]MDP9861096.1 MFS family permease [Streptosporangium brasiliense]
MPTITPPACPPCPPGSRGVPDRDRNRWRALPVVLTAVFMTTLDFFIVTVAIPSTRRDLQAGAAAMQFVIAGYGLAYAAGLILAGRLGDLHGPRRVFTAGLALFTLASAACAAAPTAGALVAARVGQGLAAALLAPQVPALLTVLYPGAGRARAFGWYGATVGLAGVSGQLVGGLLVAADPAGLGWRTCFLVNLPIGLAALALTPLLLPGAGRPGPGERRPGRRWRGLDGAGALLLAAGLLALAGPLSVGREQGWPAWTWPALAAAVPLLAGFAHRQRRRAAAGRAPLLDLAIFREPGFAPGLAAVLALFAGSAGLPFVLVLYLQDGRGLAPPAAGGLVTALNAGFLAGSAVAGRLAGRLGRRLPCAGGLALAAGLALLYHAAAGPVGWLAAGLAVAGTGMGWVMSPLIASVLAGVRDRHAAVAAGVLGTVQEMAGVLGVTAVGAVFFAVLDGGAAAAGVTGAARTGLADWAGALRAGLALLIVFALAIPVLVRLHSGARSRRSHRE